MHAYTGSYGLSRIYQCVCISMERRMSAWRATQLMRWKEAWSWRRQRWHKLTNYGICVNILCMYIVCDVSDEEEACVFERGRMWSRRHRREARRRRTSAVATAGDAIAPILCKIYFALLLTIRSLLRFSVGNQLGSRYTLRSFRNEQPEKANSLHR